MSAPDRDPDNAYARKARAVARETITHAYVSGRFDAIDQANLLDRLSTQSTGKERLPIPWRFVPKDDPTLPVRLQAALSLPVAQQELSRIRASESALRKEQRHLHAQVADLSELAAWADLRPDMAPAKTSAVPRIMDAVKRNRCTVGENTSIDELYDRLDSDPQIFLIQHDWDAVFRNADGLDGGDLRLPYETCVFEMVVAGRHVALTATQGQYDDPVAPPSPIDLLMCVATSVGRWVISHGDIGEAESVIVRQVRAVLIALDSGMAVAAAAPAPRKAATGFGKSGYSVHVVSIRPTSRREFHGVGVGSKRRLHFRRGHWRHYQSGNKTWVRWCLVGDPDLGFVEKEYRL